MAKINKLQPSQPKPTGKRPGPALVKNDGLEQALAETGNNLTELSRRLGVAPSAIVHARREGPGARLILLLFERCRVKLSKLLGRSVRCQHCQKEI